MHFAFNKKRSILKFVKMSANLSENNCCIKTAQDLEIKCNRQKMPALYPLTATWHE